MAAGELTRPEGGYLCPFMSSPTASKGCAEGMCALWTEAGECSIYLIARASCIRTIPPPK